MTSDNRDALDRHEVSRARTLPTALLAFFFAAAITAPQTARAGMEDNIRADALTVQQSGSALVCTLDYAVVDLLPIFGTPVAPFTIEIGVDFDGDQIPENVIAAIPGDPTGTTLVGHTLSQDIRAALDALPAASRIRHGARIIAHLDTGNTNNELFGTGEGDNFAAALPFHVDIKPESLVLNGANQAILTYLLDSPSQTTGSKIKFYVDDNPQNGAFDATDTLIETVNDDGTPGIKSVSVDYSAAAPSTGQLIFAQTDADGELTEANEGNNNVTGVNAAGTDLVAVSLTYDETTQNATLSYFVDSPADVGAFNIDFILDRNNSGGVNPGDAPPVATVPGNVTPGAHSETVSFAGSAPASGQFIFAWIDRAPLPSGQVTESNEIANNLIGAARTFETDLEAISLSYDSNTKLATLSYLVTSPTNVGSYALLFTLDRNNDGVPGLSDFPPVTLQIGNSSPGAHTVSVSFASAPPASNQKIFATIDPSNFNGVAESDDISNNLASAINTTPTDIVANSLSYNENSQEATLGYVVDAPIPVPAYSIKFYLDADNSGTPSAGDALVASAAGAVNPGNAYNLTISYSANPADSNQLIYVIIDGPLGSGGNVNETVEDANNIRATTNSAVTDLVAVVLTYDPDTQSATFAYTVNAPIPVDPYSIRFVIDSDNDFTLTPADTVVSTIPGNVNPGSHVQSADFSSNPVASNQLIFAVVDHANTVAEANEGNNTASTPNNAQTDLVVNFIGSLTYDDVSQRAFLNYEVESPIDVQPYDIAFILDTDLSTTLTPGDFTVGTLAGDTSPGLKSVNLSFASIPAQAGQRIWAIVDYTPSPFGNIKETNESNNLAFTGNSAELDLQAIVMTYNAVTQTATFSYRILAPTPILPFLIDFYLETNGVPGLQVPGDTLVDSQSGESSPGGFFAQGNYSANPPASGQLLYVLLDSNDAILEHDNTNNFARAYNLSPTDLVAVSIAYDSNTEDATLSYVVNAPIDVPAYNIEFYLDRDNSGALDIGDAPAIATLPGNVAPGAYTLTQDYAGNVPASNQFIFAAIDLDAGPVGAVAETDNFINNVATTSNTLGTDLVAAQIGLHIDTVNGTTTADVAYTIYGPLAVAPFSLKVGIDRDNDNVIDSLPDVLADITINDLAGRTPGVHSAAIPDFRSALNGINAGKRIRQGDKIVATLDLTIPGTDLAAVDETEDVANNAVATPVLVDLVASSVSVFLDGNGNQTKARVAFTVNSPGRVEPFDVRIGVDRDNNGVIDSPGDLLATLAAPNGDLRPGAHTITSGDIRPALNALSPQLNQGDWIIATLDVNSDGSPSNAVIELAETSNNTASQRQRVDLVADSVALVTDTNTGTTEAHVAYTVNSFAAVAPFSLKVGLDRNGNNKIDDPDGLLANVALSGGDVTAGAHSITVPGLRAALNGLTTPIKNGDVVLATLDLLLDGENEGAVNEDIEKNNNRASQSQTVDLVANSISVTSDDVAGETHATLSYSINSPANAAAFDIRIGVDRNGDDIIDADPSDLLTILSPADRSPGTHTITSGNLRSALANLASRLNDDDHIIATIDLLPDGSPVNHVIEAVEVANNITNQAQNVDLIASAIEVYIQPGSGNKVARVNYTVSSSGAVAPFVVRVGVDSDNNKIIDAGSLLEAIDLSLLADEKTRPGDRQVVTGDLTAALNALSLGNGDRIIATLDIVDDGAGTPENLVAEGEETQNNVTRSPQAVDLVAISLAFDSNTNEATLAYAVNSIGGVPAYEIAFYLDNNPQNGLLDISDTRVGFVAGSTTPGEHTAGMSFAANIPQTFQYIFAVVDDKLTVEELDESNNTANTNNTEITDLVANSLTVISDDEANDTTAAVAYTINAPDSVSPFDIKIGVDRDGNDVIDSAADILAVVPAPVLSPGSHTANFGDLRSALEGLAQRLNHGDKLIATLDLADDGSPANSVVETGGDETGNNTAGYAAIVDIVATAVEVFHRPATGDTVARVDYIINSPGAVANFFIRVGIDTDGDKIIDPGTLLATIDVAAEGPGKLRPTGDKQVVTTGDLLTVLNALPTALQNGDRIIATLDLLDDGAATPENLVIEENEDENNFARVPVTVDLVAQSLFLTADDNAGTTSATFIYTINSIGKAPSFTLRIGIDRNADNLIDDGDVADLLHSAILTDVADLAPGEHVYIVPDLRGALNKLTPRLVDGDRIVATLDLLTAPAGGDEGAVQEIVEEGNNVTSAAGTEDQIIDLAAASLSVTSGSFIVDGSYSVVSPANVPDYRVLIGRDTNADDSIDDVLLDLPGEIEPGVHNVNADVAAELRALGVASGETVRIVMQLDPANAVVERYESNNALAQNGNYVVDLNGRRITHACAVLDTAFDVTVEYDIAHNEPTENYKLCLYATDNDSPTIDAGDIQLACVDITLAADKSVGPHTVTFTGVQVSNADYATNHFFVIAALDDGNAAAETDETNNVLVRTNGPASPAEDADGDGTPDCFDGCPADADKTSAGICGCGTADTDTDNDGTPDCNDGCPNDDLKIQAGVCGCGSDDQDSDNDSVPDCVDECPNDGNKIAPGICGCGTEESENDADQDLTPDCIDSAPNDPNVPNDLGEPPAGQPTDNTNGNGNANNNDNDNGIRISVVQLIPGLPVCGVELCGTNLFAPLFGFLFGYGGLRTIVRRRKGRR